MGLIVDVYRSARRDNIDCTNGGISSKHVELTLVNVSGPFDPNEDRPAAMLVKGNVPGHVRIVPAKLVNGEYVEDTRWWMMGGNYASTSDSRLGEAIAKLIGTQYRFFGAVAVHDRHEG